MLGIGCSSTPPWSCPAPPAGSGVDYVPACEGGKAASTTATGSGFCAGQTQADADAACQAALGVLPGAKFTLGSTTYVVEGYLQPNCGFFGVWQGDSIATRTCKVGDCECQ